MSTCFDPTDVPPVSHDDLLVPMHAAIASGRGLALFNGLAEGEIRALECEVWKAFPDDAQTRLAVALRFRALLSVFAARRLKDLFLMNGFKLIAEAVREASSQRLNSAFGFKAQAFVMALAPAEPPAPALHQGAADERLAA